MYINWSITSEEHLKNCKPGAKTKIYQYISTEAQSICPLKGFTRVRCGLGTWLWASLARSRRGCRPYPVNHRTIKTGLRIRIRIIFGSWIRIRIEVKIQKGSRGCWAVEGRGLTMEPSRDFRPGVEDSHHFDEEQDPNPDTYPHYCEKLEIRISIKVMRITQTLFKMLQISRPLCFR
jgi:hypothetical protein